MAHEQRPQQRNAMYVGGQQFQTERAFMVANLTPTRFWWSLAILGRGRWRGQLASAHAYCSNLFPLENMRLNKWQDALSSDVAWAQSYDDQRGSCWGKALPKYSPLPK